MLKFRAAFFIMENFTSDNTSKNYYDKPYNDESAVFSTVMLLSIMAFGIFGNSMVIASFIKFRRLRTVTNYFLISLAVADLMLASLSIPFWLTIRLDKITKAKLSTTVLYLSWQFIDILCSTASIMNLCVIAIDRHLAILSPLHYSAKMTPKRAISSIAAGWIYAVVCAGLSLVSTKKEYQPLAGRVYSGFISLAAFLFPLFIILYYYGKIFTVALKQARRLNAEGMPFVYGTERERRTLVQRELKIAKTLALVVGTFIVCWSPFFLVMLSYSICGVRCISRTNVFIATSKWMHYSSTTANPIIYTLFTKSFRQSFKTMLCCKGYKSCYVKPCANHFKKTNYNATGGREQFILRSIYKKTSQGELVTQTCTVEICKKSPPSPPRG